MDIKVGEYVRTAEGLIRKVDQIGNCIFWLEDNTSISLGDINIKHNFNINELLEEGDILEYTVNNLTTPKVTRIIKYKEARTFKEYLGVEGYKLEQIKIIRVITKEQFKDVSYEV